MGYDSTANITVEVRALRRLPVGLMLWPNLSQHSVRQMAMLKVSKDIDSILNDKALLDTCYLATVKLNFRAAIPLAMVTRLDG
eukprot:scaffold381287_cov30-Prasinocladus_malaysianus.AAC.1